MLFICTEAEAFRLLYPSARQLETIAAELGHAERLIKAIHKEKMVGSRLPKLHIKLTGRYAEEEEE